jgi:phage baseplate assembly protein V
MSEARETRRRVMNMIARGVIAESNDAGGMQTVQLSLLHEEAKAAAERIQNYGFSSHPPANSEAVAIFVGGGRDHALIIALDDRASRFTGLQAGEVAIYSNEGDSIVLKRDNTVEVTTRTLIVNAEEAIEIEASEIRIKGDIELDGSLTATGSISAPGGGVGGPSTSSGQAP